MSQARVSEFGTKMQIPRSLRLSAVVAALVAAPLFFLWRADPRTVRQVGSVAATAADGGSSRIAGDSEAAVEAQRVVVPAAAADSDSSRAEIPNRNTFAVWHGRPRGEFLGSYWGISQQEVLESLVADGFPERIAKELTGAVIADNFVEWDDAVPLIKEAIRGQGSTISLEATFNDAWGLSLANVLTRISNQSARAMGPDVSRNGVRSWLQANGGHVLQVHADLREAVLAHSDRLLETGDVDRFPVATMPQGRGKHRVPAPGARRYKFFQASGGGWVAHVAIYAGACDEVDRQHRRLRNSWLELLPRALMESSSISISSYDLQQLGLFAN